MQRNIDSKMAQTIFKICSCPAWGLVKTKQLIAYVQLFTRRASKTTRQDDRIGEIFMS